MNQISAQTHNVDADSDNHFSSFRRDFIQSGLNLKLGEQSSLLSDLKQDRLTDTSTRVQSPNTWPLQLLCDLTLTSCTYTTKGKAVFTTRGPGCIHTGSLSPGLCGLDKSAGSRGSTEPSSGEPDLV